MNSSIKRYRLKSLRTETDAAKAAKVSKSTYQRWESGSLSPSPEKLVILAEEFGTTVQALSGEVALFDMTGFQENDEARIYFGEVAIHFQGQGKPLLLPISRDECNRALGSMQTDNAFLILSSLDNRTVFIRKDAIADLYFSGDGCNDYGPAGVEYEEFVAVHPDIDFWSLVEQLDDADFDPDELPVAFQQVRALLEPTDDYFDKLVEEGHTKEEQREEWLKVAKDMRRRLFGLATSMYWQVGVLSREARLDDESDVYGPLVPLDGAKFDDEFMGTPITIEVEERNRIIQINPKALDYISVPTHKYEAKLLEVLDELDV